MECKSCGQDNPQEARFCSNCGASLIATSKSFPRITVGSSYGNGWRQLWKYFLELFLILIIGFIIGIPSGMGGWSQGTASGFLGFLGMVYTILIVWPVDYGVSFSYLKASRGDTLEVKNMFEAFKNYWNAVLASLLVTIIVGIGLIVFIVPGIIFACKLVFTPYLVVDRKMAVIEAVKGSWRMTGGYTWKVFLMGLLAIPIFIAGLICFGVGVIISIMWIRAAFASLYHSVSIAAQPPE
ncbi:MAG: zinc ribbon domain-containing protein [Dehalococcoidia bacterium]|nr:MAG: zinc ribbon domain-containing protein [Dehalococcoidia bacterium]